MEFHHHPDDIIFLRSPQGTYMASLSDFLGDCVTLGNTYQGRGEYDELRFIQGKGLLAYKDGNQIFLGLHESNIESILSQIDLFRQEEAKRIAAQQHPDPVPPTPEQVARKAVEFLKSTDWMLTRQTEHGIPVPQAVVSARNKAYAAIPPAFQISIPKEYLP